MKLIPTYLNKKWLLAALLPATLLQADEQSESYEDLPLHEIGDYVVTATRIEVPIDTTGSSITVITAEDIDNSKQSFVVDVLKQVPGLNIRQTGRHGTRARVSIRGTEAYQSTILLNGMKITDTNDGDGFSISNILSDNIERIEVLRGTQSVLYGSDATGGVINIITKKGEKGFRGAVDVMAGAHETVKGSLFLSGATDKLDYSLSFSRIELDSNAADLDPEEDKYENTSITANIGYEYRKWLKTRLLTYLQESHGDSDSSAAQDLVNTGVNRNYFLGLQFHLDPSIEYWDSQLNLGYSALESQFLSGSTWGRSNYEATTMRVDWQNNIRINENNSLVAGLEYNYDEGKQVVSWAAGSVKDRFQTKSAYAQYRFDYRDKLYLDIGGRLVDADSFGDAAVFQTAGTYHIDATNTRLKANYGTSFNAPNTFYFSNALNPNSLEPEEGRSFDVGFEQGFFKNKLQVGANYFYSEIKSQFAWSGGKVSNVESIRNQGYELFASYQPLDNLTIDANATYLDSYDRGTGKDTHHQPKKKLYAGVTYQPIADKLNLHFNMNYVGSMFNGNSETFYSSSYMLWNGAASYKITKDFEIYCRVDNIFDSEYQNMKDFNGRNYAPIQGMSTYIGARYHF